MYNLQPLRDAVWLCRTSSLQKCSHLATRKSRSGKGPSIPKNAVGWNDSRFRKTNSYSTSPTSIGKTRPYYLGVLFQIWYNDTVIPVVGWCLQKHFRIKIIFLTLCREVPIALSAVPRVGRQLSFKSSKIDVSCNGWCTTTIQTSSFERTQSKLFHFAPIQQLKHLVPFLKFCSLWGHRDASGLLSGESPSNLGRLNQQPGWVHGLKQKNKRNLGFTLRIIFMACRLASRFRFFNKWVRDANIVECILLWYFWISLEQKRYVHLYEEESVFLLGLEYSVPAFAFIWVMDIHWIFIHASEKDLRQGFPGSTEPLWAISDHFRLPAIAKHRPMVRAFGQIPPARFAQWKHFKFVDPKSIPSSKFIINSSFRVSTTELTATLCCSSLKALRSCHMHLAWFHGNANHLFRGWQGITLLMGQDLWIRIPPWRGKYNHPQIQSICSVYFGGSTFAIALRGNMLVVIHLYS